MARKSRRSQATLADAASSAQAVKINTADMSIANNIMRFVIFTHIITSFIQRILDNCTGIFVLLSEIAFYRHQWIY